MLPKLQNRFDNLEFHLDEILNFLDSRTPEKRKAAPEGAWCANQILHHLWTSEKGTTAYLKKKLQAPPSEIAKSGLAGWVRSKLLGRALKNTKTKFRAPSVLGEMPEEVDYAQLKTEFRATREALKNVLESVAPEQIDRAYFNHPRAGRINIAQTMDFLEAHFIRHVEQIKERSA